MIEEQKYPEYDRESPAFGEMSDRVKHFEDVLAEVVEIVENEPVPLDEEP